MRMRYRQFHSLNSIACALVAGLVLASVARATPRETISAGVVDGSAFAGLASDEDSIVEVHLSGSLLSSIASVDSADEGFGSFLRGLRSIEAYVVKIGEDTARVDRAIRLVRDTELKLERQGWERLARIREKSSNVNIFVRHNEPFIDGLVVLIVDKDQGEVVFANIAGRIDLARLGELSRMVDIRGLDGIGDSDTPAERSRKERQKAAKSKTAKPDDDTPQDSDEH